MAGLDDPRLAGLEKALGRVALVQMDNRYCTNRRDWIASIPPLRASWFWWKAAHINSLWAAAHQYDHIVYCSPGCSYCSNNGSLVMRRLSWCKIRVVSEVMQAGEHSTVVFMDSDAYVSEPRLTLSALLVRYTWPRDWPIGDAGGREGRGGAAHAPGGDGCRGVANHEVQQPVDEDDRHRKQDGEAV